MTNKPTRESIEAAIDQLGAEKGKGEDAQVKFALQMIEGGYHNVFDLTSNKHGADRDDATVMAERYAKAQGQTGIFNAKAPNQRKAISCARTGIKIGSWPKGGNGEPIATINNFLSKWRKHRANPALVGKLVDANNALMSFSRAQLKRDTLIDDSQFDEFIFKSDPDEATAEEIIASAVKKLDKLIDGSASHGTVQNNGVNVVSSRNLLRRELAEIAKAKNPQIKQPAKV